MVVGALKKRLAKACGTDGTKDAPAAKATAGSTGHQDSSSLPSPEPKPVAPRK